MRAQRRHGNATYRRRGKKAAETRVQRTIVPAVPNSTKDDSRRAAARPVLDHGAADDPFPFRRAVNCRPTQTPEKTYLGQSTEAGSSALLLNNPRHVLPKGFHRFRQQICQRICLRRAGSPSIDCCSISWFDLLVAVVVPVDARAAAVKQVAYGVGIGTARRGSKPVSSRGESDKFLIPSAAHHRTPPRSISSRLQRSSTPAHGDVFVGYSTLQQ